jgi:hypothetical protein
MSIKGINHAREKRSDAEDQQLIFKIIDTNTFWQKLPNHEPQ